MEGMVNHTLPDRLVNHIHKTSRSISDTSFKHKDSVTILHDNDFWNWICKPEGWKEINKWHLKKNVKNKIKSRTLTSKNND